MKLAKRLMMRQTYDDLWSPSEISGIVLFDALDAANITLVGPKVSAWADMFGVGASATQGTDGARPTMGTGELTFDGGDYLTIASSKTSSWVKALHSTGGTIVGLARFYASDNPNAACCLCGTNRTSSEATGFSVFFDDRSTSSRNNALAVNVGRTSPGNFAVGHISQNIVTPNQYNLIDIKLDPDNATAVGRSAISINGATDVTGNAKTSTPVTSDATYDLQIGAGGNNTLPIVGGLKSLAFVPAILSLADRQKLVGWMAHRHVATELLQSDHPYKTIAP